MATEPLWPALWLIGKIGKHVQRPYRWVIDGPEAVGKTTWWRLLRARLNPVSHMKRVPTKQPLGRNTYSVYLKDTDKRRMKIKGEDYPHNPEMTAQQIHSIWPTDVTLIIDLHSAVRGYLPPVTDDVLLAEALQTVKGPFQPSLNPLKDPIIDHIQAILSGLTSEYYRMRTARWGNLPYPKAILPWRLLRSEGWGGFPLRGERIMTDFYLFFNKIDLIPVSYRAKLVQPIIHYYEKFIFGTEEKPTYLTYLTEEKGLRYHCIGTSLTQNRFVWQEDLCGQLQPIQNFLTKIANDKEA